MKGPLAFFRSFSSDPGKRLLVNNLWSERRLVILTLMLSAFGAALEGLGIGLIVPFLKSITEPDAAVWRTGWQTFDVFILGVDDTQIGRLYRISTVIISTVWLRALLGYVASVTGARMCESVLDRMRRQIGEQLLSVSLRFFSTTRAGDLINTLTSEVARVRHLFNVVTNAITQVILLVTYLTVIVILSWQMALFTLGLCAIIFVVVNPLLHRLLFQGSVISAANSHFTSVATELISGIRTVTAFGAQGYERQKFKDASRGAADANVSAARQSSRVGPISQGVGSTALIGMVIIGVQFFVLPGTMSMARLIAFIVALMRLLPLARSLNDARAQLGVVKGALEKVTGLIQQEDKPYLTHGSRSLDRFRKAIEIRNVWFSYEPDAPVLKNVSLTIEKGQITAFVGSSGAGKSTLADLIARFYDPDRGDILIDGVDLREFSREALRSKIAIVSQDTFLFNDTVRANIAYGLEGVSDDVLREAAEEANAIEFIGAMEDGFDTILGDRGARISGGQRQRIAIARAILRNPDILILDEATSALDSKSERLIQESLEYLMRDRTVITIAHRLSTIENADKVVVLEQGRVVEAGLYRELLNAKGHLWEFHRLQQFQAA